MRPLLTHFLYSAFELLKLALHAIICQSIDVAMITKTVDVLSLECFEY
jgi:hypothetical protein